MKFRKVMLCFIWIAAAVALFLVVISGRPKSKPSVARAAKERAAVERFAAVASAPSSGFLSGRVQSSDGDRLSQARVCAADAQSGAVGRPRTTCADADSNGEYTIALATPGAYSIAAEASGFKPGSARGGQLIGVARGERTTGIDIVLEHGGARLAGLVLDLTGGPVPGATIRATRFAPPSSTVSTESDHEGKFTFWVVPGEVTLNTEAAGYASSTLPRMAPSSDVVIRLTPGSNVQGSVISAEDHQPVTDIEVRAFPIKGANPLLHRSGVSNADGVFGIAGIAPGAYVLVAEGSGWRGSSDGALEIGLAQSITNAIVTVRHVATVKGMVASRLDGLPCLMGTVALARPGHPNLADPPSVSDLPGAIESKVPEMMVTIAADGAVYFPAVPPGTYHAVVQCTDRILSEGPTNVEVGTTDVAGLIWKVDAGRGFVVHMVDEADNPLPGALVWLNSPPRAVQVPVKADGSGRAEYPGVLYPGMYWLTPARGHGGYEGDPVNVDLREGTGQVEVTVRFRGKASILATVTGTDSKPIDDIAVEATLLSPSEQSASALPAPAASTTELPEQPAAGIPPPAARFRAIGLGSGRFRIGPLAAGRYKLEANDGGNPPFEATTPSGTIEVGSGVASAAIRVDRGASIHGIIVDQSKQPIPDTWVSATCGKAPGQPSPAHLFGRAPPYATKRTMSGRDGHFTISDVQVNTFCTVRAEEPYGLVGTINDVRPGDDVSVSLTEDAKAASRENGALQQSGLPFER